jgi:hypothetical protein
MDRAAHAWHFAAALIFWPALAGAARILLVAAFTVAFSCIKIALLHARDEGLLS